MESNKYVTALYVRTNQGTADFIWQNVWSPYNLYLFSAYISDLYIIYIMQNCGKMWDVMLFLEYILVQEVFW